MPAPKPNKSVIRLSFKRNWDKLRVRRDVMLYLGRPLEKEELTELLRDAKLDDIETLQDLKAAMSEAPDWKPILEFFVPLLSDPEAGRAKQVL